MRAAVGIAVHAEHRCRGADVRGEPGARLREVGEHVEALGAVGGDRHPHRPAAAPCDLPNARPHLARREVHGEHLGAPRTERLERADLRAGADQRDRAPRQRQPLGVLGHELDGRCEGSLDGARPHPAVELFGQRGPVQAVAAVRHLEALDGRRRAVQHPGPEPRLRSLTGECIRQLCVVRLAPEHESAAHRVEARAGDRQRTGWIGGEGCEGAHEAHVVPAPSLAGLDLAGEPGVCRARRVRDDRAAGRRRRAPPVDQREANLARFRRGPRRLSGRRCAGRTLHKRDDM